VAAGVPAAWVTGDEVYGSWELRRWLEDQRRPYVLAVRANQHVWAGPRQSMVAALAEALPGRAWHRVTIAAGRRHTAETILRAWFEGKAEHTIRSYRLDLEDFALYFSRALAITPPMPFPVALGRLFRQASTRGLRAGPEGEPFGSWRSTPSTQRRSTPQLRAPVSSRLSTAEVVGEPSTTV